MDYGIYFETLIRTTCYEHPEWAKNLVIVLMVLTAGSIVAGLFSLQWIHDSILPLVLVMIAVLLIFVTLTVMQFAPIYATGEYKYEAEVTEAFNLSEFEMDERFTNIEYSNGKLKFKSYEYIEEIEE